jgi:hypothetical protein
MQRRMGEWAKRRMAIGRAKNSARTGRGRILKVFAPVLSRSVRVFTPCVYRTNKTVGSAAIYDNVTLWVAAQNRRVTSKSETQTLGAPSFSPYQSPFRPFAVSPLRRFA